MRWLKFQIWSFEKSQKCWIKAMLFWGFYFSFKILGVAELIKKKILGSNKKWGLLERVILFDIRCILVYNFPLWLMWMSRPEAINSFNLWFHKKSMFSVYLCPNWVQSTLSSSSNNPNFPNFVSECLCGMVNLCLSWQVGNCMFTVRKLSCYSQRHPLTKL